MSDISELRRLSLVIECLEGKTQELKTENAQLTAENEQVVDDYQDIGKELGSALDENMRLTQENEGLVSVIESVEWVTGIKSDDSKFRFCPSCFAEIEDGDELPHEPGCRIDAALRPVKIMGEGDA